MTKRSRSQSLDRSCLITTSSSDGGGDSSISNDPYKESLTEEEELEEDFADLTLKTSLPQKSYEFGVEIGR